MGEGEAGGRQPGEECFLLGPGWRGGGDGGGGVKMRRMTHYVGSES